ncbi:unnamed protein product [Strongylus vulgaris]|uniref:Uncharacterized protein n=1 Tax=Strongylus vulgaris TaxID=40348 RepID=A0A3P7JF42_STRVU|nr:unnamed protein product [Strongylus vulgaris]
MKTYRKLNEVHTESEEDNVVKLSFPLPPPVGDFDDMDETQYDHLAVRAFRHHELGGSEEARFERKEDYVPDVPPRKNKMKQILEEQNQASKE